MKQLVKESLNENMLDAINPIKKLKGYIAGEVYQLEQAMDEAEGEDIKTYLRLEAKLEVYTSIMDMMGWDL